VIDKGEKKMILKLFACLVLLYATSAIAQDTPKSISLTDKSNVPPKDIKDILKALQKECPNVRITSEATKSDYTLEALKKTDLKAGQEGSFDLTLFDRDGKTFRTASNSSVGSAAKDVCHAIFIAASGPAGAGGGAPSKPGETAVIVKVMDTHDLTQSVDARGSGGIVPALTGRRTHTAPNIWADVLTADASGNYSVGTTVVDPVAGVVSPTVSRPNNTIVLFGDSITGKNCTGTSGSSTYIENTGWFHWANSILGQPFVVTNCAGVGGNTTTQMLARIQTDVIAFKPGWVTVMGGNNDIASSFTSATTIANLKAIYAALNAAGIKIVAATITPNVNYTAGAQQTAWAAINAWLREYAKTQNNFILWDAAAVLIDATNANVVTLAGMTSDGVHPSATGGYLLGKSLAAVLLPFVSAPAVLPTWNSDPGNMLVNGLSTGSAGTPMYGSTGTAATGWVLANNGTSCVGSQTSRTDGLGAVQIAAGTGTTVICSYQQILSTGFAAGDQLWAQAEIMAGSTNGVELYVNLQPSNTNYSYLLATTDYLLNQTLPHLVLRLPVFTVPAGTTTLYVKVQGYGTSGSTQVGRVELRRVVAP
jgi:lysophospholipase L1-like esterase